MLPRDSIPLCAPTAAEPWRAVGGGFIRHGCN